MTKMLNMAVKNMSKVKPNEQVLLYKQYNNLNTLIKPKYTKISSYKGFHSGMTKIKEHAYK